MDFFKIALKITFFMAADFPVVRLSPHSGNSLLLRCFIVECHVSEMILVGILTDATGVAHVYISGDGLLTLVSW